MAFQLRVFWPDDTCANQSELSLCKVFRDRILAEKTFLWDARTVREYQCTLNLWDDITGDPPLEMISETILRDFTTALTRRTGRNGQPISANTIRKHLRHLRALFRELGPRRNGKGLGLMADIPYVQMPRAVRQAPVIWTPPQLKQLAEAAKHFHPGPVTGPIPPADWWLVLLRILWNSAVRIGTALALRWEWLQPDGWIAVPPEALKGKHTGRRFYLNTATREHLLRIQKTNDGPLLPWSATMMTLQRWRRRLQRLAGLPADEKHGFHAIRRSALSAIARLNPLVARAIAGHAQGDVLLEHYFADDVIVATLESLPQPF